MRIADEIAHIEREFISGELLLAALTRQEAIPEYQVASWFVRNIEQLERLPMLAFNGKRRDFRLIEEPWSHEVFLDVADDYQSYGWDEHANGYVGGWLSSDLKSFFSLTNVAFPEHAIQEIRQNGATLPLAPLEPEEVATETTDTTLATRERGSLLVIIAALAGEANIPILTPSKAADLISDMTQKMGAYVAKRTIEEHLKKIPDALERRMK